VEILVGERADLAAVALEALRDQGAVKDHADDRIGATELALVGADELRDGRLALHESADEHRRVVRIAHLLRCLGDHRGDLVLAELHDSSKGTMVGRQRENLHNASAVSAATSAARFVQYALRAGPRNSPWGRTRLSQMMSGL